MTIQTSDLALLPLRALFAARTVSIYRDLSGITKIEFEREIKRRLSHVEERDQMEIISAMAVPAAALDAAEERVASAVGVIRTAQLRAAADAEIAALLAS